MDPLSGPIRLGFAVFAAVVYGIWGAPVPHNPAMAWAAIAGGAIYAALLVAVEPYENWNHRTTAAAVSVTDATLITVFIVATGGWVSPWFLLWYPSILVLSLHLGREETMAAATGYVVLYGVVAAFDGALVADTGTFVVRMSFVYAVGALGVILSDAFLEEALGRRRYEALARESSYQANLLESSLDATEDGVLVVDLDGNIVLWNDRFQEMWGLPDEVLEARDDDEAIAYVLDQLENPDEFRETIEALYDQPHKTSFDVLEFEDGRILERFSRPQILDGEPVGRVWTFQDVTERKRRERDLEDYARRLEESNEDLERFANAVSHDLRTPLGGVLANLDLLEEDVRAELDGDARESFEHAMESAERMDRMIEDLLEYARLGGDEASDEVVDPDDVLREVEADLEHRIREEGATVTAGDLPPVQVPRTHLQTVLQNIVSNALRYRSETPPEIHVGAERDGDGMVRLSVADNGEGIAEEEQEKVLELFAQGSNGNDEGTGTGLSTCQRIVQRYGGSIAIDSSEGGGTTVHLTLPAGPGDSQDGDP